MSTEFKQQVNTFFRHFTDNLDISDSNYEKAKQRYDSISKWLERDESKVAKYRPVIYPQGSFELGTVIKPISDEDQYDVDLVCEVQLSKSEITQKQLKEHIGDEVIAYAKAQNMTNPPEPGKRCWTLEYADGAQFHMDILPAIPDDESFRLSMQRLNVPKECANFAISITDTESDNYSSISNDWPHSNPRGYVAWFEYQMKEIADRIILEKAMPLRTHEIKSPLQKAIQILKRHRDIMFAKDTEDKPISIIITTLAGHSYNNQDNIYDALLSILKGMPNYIEIRNGTYWVPNPVKPNENFADRWENHKTKQSNFFDWLKQVQYDFEVALASNNVQKLVELLKLQLGTNLMEKSASTAFGSSTYKVIKDNDYSPPNINISNPSKPWGI